tara:strand:+ start:223 stop:1368 length:1146 start_codon:yes stop_codon:yes gene_type:complete
VLSALDAFDFENLAIYVHAHLVTMYTAGLAPAASIQEVKSFISSSAFEDTVDHLSHSCVCQADGAVAIVQPPADVCVSSDIRVHSGIMTFLLAPISSARVWSVQHKHPLRLSEFATSGGGEIVSDDDWQQLVTRARFVDACQVDASECRGVRRFSFSGFVVVDTLLTHHIFVGTHTDGTRTHAFILADDVSMRPDFVTATGRCRCATDEDDTNVQQQLFMFDASLALTEGVKTQSAFSYVLFLACIRFRIASDASLPFFSILCIDKDDAIRVAFYNACVAHVAHGRCAVSHDRSVRLMEELSRPDARNEAQVHDEIHGLGLEERMYSGFTEPNVANVLRQHIVHLTDAVTMCRRRHVQRGVLLLAHMAALHITSRRLSLAL